MCSAKTTTTKQALLAASTARDRVVTASRDRVFSIYEEPKYNYDLNGNYSYIKQLPESGLVYFPTKTYESAGVFGGPLAEMKGLEEEVYKIGGVGYY